MATSAGSMPKVGSANSSDFLLIIYLPFVGMLSHQASLCRAQKCDRLDCPFGRDPLGSFHRGGTFKHIRHKLPVVGCSANACTTVKCTTNRVTGEAPSCSSVAAAPSQIATVDQRSSPQIRHANDTTCRLCCAASTRSRYRLSPSRRAPSFLGRGMSSFRR